MIRNQNQDDDTSSSSRKRFTTCDNGDVAPWSNLNHDVLFFVMMQLGIEDFISFSRVCKSWRSLALSNKNNFITSRPPMVMSISRDTNNKNICYMSDFELREFQTVLPPSASMTCFGLNSGYLILFGNARHDFWLVNPITRHQLHFPACTLYGNGYPDKAILVFSPSISRWMFVISDRFSSKISFYMADNGRWKHVPSTLPIIDLHAFNGKIYTLHTDCCICELRFNPNPKLITLKTKNIPKPNLKRPEFVSSVENLCIIDNSWEASNKEVLKLDFGEMKWVSLEKTIEEYAFFLSNFNYSAAIKRESWESWADPRTQYKIYDYFHHDNFLNPNGVRQGMFFNTDMWYFPHDCLNVSLVDY